MIKKITPCLWFNFNAEEAIEFYSTIFKDLKITKKSYYGESVYRPEMKGKLMTAYFEMNGQEFMTLNGGPEFQFTEAISLVVYCDTQAEIDRLWEQLGSNGGKPIECGWVKDRFGMSWQIVPTILDELTSGDPKKSDKVMAALLNMKKLDIEKLKAAYNS